MQINNTMVKALYIGSGSDTKFLPELYGILTSWVVLIHYLLTNARIETSAHPSMMLLKSCFTTPTFHTIIDF